MSRAARTRHRADPAGPRQSGAAEAGEPIDLRSDTVTRPDAEMRRAMAGAEVGDDVYGEDPTVAALEEEAAAAVGHAAALFVPSGTMGNQIALRLQGAPGQEVICDSRSHMVVLEMGAMSALSGLVPRTLDSPQGLLDPAAVEAAVSPGTGSRQGTCLLAVENSHNLAGGSVYDRAHLEALLAVAGRHGLPAHLDGARIWNAAEALGTSAAALAAGFSSIMFCLSKGLGAPVGSLLCGSRDLVSEARRVRKMFGGGMRQAGVLAAAGLVALRRGPSRLAADHANARLLAAAVAELPGAEIDPAAVRTNIVVFRVTPLLGGPLGGGRRAGAAAAPPADLAGAVLARLRAAGVLATQVSHDQVRMVTHRDAGRERIEQAIGRMRRALAPRASAG
ncbi:MAG: threonine aldolase family protein [Acidobacteria bacterium]|nr:threonine aldolase family protein [Acidobacteriota bacterium]